MVASVCGRSEVTSHPPTLPTDARDAGDPEVAACCDTIANHVLVKGLGRESKPHAEKCTSGLFSKELGFDPRVS